MDSVGRCLLGRVRRKLPGHKVVQETYMWQLPVENEHYSVFNQLN